MDGVVCGAVQRKKHLSLEWRRHLFDTYWPRRKLASTRRQEHTELRCLKLMAIQRRSEGERRSDYYIALVWTHP